MALSTFKSRPGLTRLLTAVLASIGLTVLMLLGLRSFAPAHGAPAQPLAPDLQVDKQGPETAFAGEFITYTIHVTNATGVPLDGVIITDTWTKQDYTGAYETEGNVSVVSVTVVQQPVKFAQFSLAPMPASSHGILRIPMFISTSLQPDYNGTPTILGDSVVITTSTPSKTAGSDNVNTVVIGPVLRLTKVASPATTRPGRLITFTLALENKNRSDAIDATNVVISETLPNHLMHYSAIPVEWATYYPATRTIQWNVPTVTVGSFAYVTFTARVTPTQVFGNTNNPRANCRAFADHLPKPIQCYQDAQFSVDNVFEKKAFTVSPPPQTGTISRTFPNRVLTYTVYVYNPFTETVSSLRITDTLPQYGTTPAMFQYLGLVGSQPNPPTLVNYSSNIVIWDTPPIGAWSVYSFAFRAFVPPYMPIATNQTQELYTNKVGGSYADVALPANTGNDDSMKVFVVPQILTPKIVTPSKQLFGLPVTYTLTISNSGPTTIRDIRITDTLGCSFTWGRLISGQTPNVPAPNMAVWEGITLTGYAQTTMVFSATVYGALNATCYNTIEGYSPDTYIVKRTQLAPVVVDVPFRYNKTVNPSSVVLGGSIEYTVQQFNVGGINATMNGFTDVLPLGFYYGASPVYTDPISMPLLANHQNQYQKTFPVNVVTTAEPCDNLPRAVPQKAYTFGMRIIDPPTLAYFWVNAADAAPVTVHPQVKASKLVSPSAVLPGGIVTFTIVLSNNTALAVNQVRVTDTLPGGFQYGGVLPGTDDPISTISSNIVWIDQDVPASGVRTLAFTVTAPTTLATYQNIVKASSMSNPLICIPRTTSSITVKPPRIRMSNKTATPNTVGPYGLFTYDLSLLNEGPFAITMSRFTDTLPGLTGHPWKFIAMQSGDPQPVSTDPPAWQNLTINAGATLRLRFTVRTDTQFGTYPNLPATSPPPMGAGQYTATLPAGWVITAASSIDAKVSVIPGVGLNKEVSPTEATTGGSVIYTITLVNLSGSTINNVRVTDTLPSGFTFESAVAGDVPLTASPLVWSLGNIQSGEQYKKVLAFRVRIANNLPSSTYYNRVDARSDNILIPSTDLIAPVVVHGVPTLQLSKSAAPSQAKPGREVTYTLVLANPEDQGITARITDTLPNYFSFAGMVSGPSPSLTGPQLVWPNLTVPAHTTTTLVLRALVAADTPDGVYYNQLDGISQYGTIPGTGPTAPVEVAAPRFDIQVSKTNETSFTPLGGTTIYKLYYTNTLNPLNITATNVVLTDIFSPAAHLIADAPGWNMVSSGVYTRLIGDLPAGTSGWVTFTLNVPSDLPVEYLSITNTVQISAEPPPEVPDASETPTNNNASTDTDVVRGADIVVTGLTASATRFRQGGIMTVWVTVQNQGPDATQGPGGYDYFGTDLYVKPANSAPPSGPGDRYLGACPTATNYCPSTIRRDLYKLTRPSGEGLAPGESWVLTYTYAIPTAGEQWLYVQADTFWGENGDPDPTMFGSSQHGRIVEGREDNNILGPVSVYVDHTVYLPMVLRR